MSSPSNPEYTVIEGKLCELLVNEDEIELRYKINQYCQDASVATDMAAKVTALYRQLVDAAMRTMRANEGCQCLIGLVDGHAVCIQHPNTTALGISTCGLGQPAAFLDLLGGNRPSFETRHAHARFEGLVL